MRAMSSPRMLDSSKSSTALMSPSNPSVTPIRSNKKEKFEYVVLFPPGAMGLELEPVIKSSEREIGCRVKDFYFGVDYNGIEPAQLERLVNIGDIICSIDDISVRSLRFPEIVELLRSRRNQQRIIRLKNMNAMWSKVDNQVTPPPTSKQRERIQAPKFFNENTVNGTPQEEISPIKPTSSLRPTKSPKFYKSPSSNRQSLTPRQNIRLEQPQVMEMVRAPITPSAVKLLTQQQGGYSTPVIQRDESFQIQDPLLNEVQEVGAVIGKKAAEFAFIATESLSNRAQTALSHAAVVVPRYSMQEMNQVVQKKNELLAELTRSVLLLREEEEKRMQLEREVEGMHDLKRENEDLNEALAHKDSILEDYALRMKTLETELSILRNESKQDQQMLKVNTSAIESMKSHNSELMQLIQSLQTEKQKVVEENQQLIKTLEQTEIKFHQQERKLMENLSNTREKANLSMSEKNSELNALRNQMETAQAKWEEHQAMMANKFLELEEQKQQLELELNKTKVSSQHTSTSLQVLVHQRDSELQVATATITELRSKLASMDITHNHLKTEFDSCNALLSKAQASILEYQSQIQEMEKVAQEKASEYEEMKEKLSQSEEDRQFSLSVNNDLKREHEYFNDKIRLMELTITAQSNEIETLQKDLTRIEKAKDSIEKNLAHMKNNFKKVTSRMRSQAEDMRVGLTNLAGFVQQEFSEMGCELSRGTSLNSDCQKLLIQKVLEQESQISSFEAKIASLSQSEATLIRQLEQREKDLLTTESNFHEEKEVLQGLLISTQERKSSLEHTVTALQQGLQSMQEKYQLSKKECRSKDDDINSLRRQVTSFEQLTNCLKESTQEELHSQKEQLESTIEIYIGQLNKYENDIVGLTASLRKAEDQASSVTEKLTLVEAELVHSQSMVEELKGSLQKEIDRHNRAKDEWEIYAMSQVTGWTENLNCLNLELKDVSDRCVELEKERNALRDAISLNENTYATELASKGKELVDLKSLIQSLEDSIREKSEQIDNLAFDLASSKEVIANVKMQKESTELKQLIGMNALESKCVNLEQSVDKLTKENAKLQELSQSMMSKAHDAEELLTEKTLKYQQICFALSSTVVMEITAMKQSLSDMRSEVVCLGGIQQNIFNAMETRNSALAKDLNERKNATKSLSSQMNNQQSLLREKETLFQRVMDAENRCMELELQLMNRVTETMNMTKQLEEKAETCKSTEQLNDDLQESIEKKNAEILHLQAQLKDSVQSLEFLRQELSSVAQKLSIVENEKVHLSHSFDRSMEEVAVLKASLQTAEHKSKMLEEQIRSTKERVLKYQQLDEATSTNSISAEDVVVQELTMVEQAIMSARSQEGELRQMVRESEDIIAMLKHQSVDLQKENQINSLQLVDFEKKVSVMERQIESLQTERQQLLFDVAALRQELDRSTETSVFVENSRHQLETMLNSERQINAKLTSDLSIVKDIMRSATDEMENQSTAIASLQSKILGHEETIHNLQQRLQECDREIIDKSVTIQKLDNAILEISKEKTLAQQQCNEIMATLDSTQLDMQHKYEAQLGKVASFEKELQERQDELSANLTATHYLEKQRDSLLSNLQVLEKSMEVLANEKEQLQQEKETLQNNVVELEKTQKVVEEVVQQLSALTTSQSKEIEALQSTLMKHQLECSEKNKEIESLTSTVDEMKSIIEDRDNQVESKLAEITTLQSENKTLQNVAKENQKRITALREVIQTLENALNLAVTREEEHVGVVKGYEHQLRDREQQFQVLQQQFEELKNKFMHHRSQYEKQIELYQIENVEQKKTIQDITQALTNKTNELESLHRHISELLLTTTSPVKAENVNKNVPPENALGSVAGKLNGAEKSVFDSEEDKENIMKKTSPPPNMLKSHTNQSPPNQNTGSPGTVDVWYDTEGQWHDQLLTLSLNMHEVLSYVFYLLQQVDRKDDVKFISSPESVKLWSSVSKLQQKLHEVLVRPPWVNQSDPVQSLTAAHELFPHISEGIASTATFVAGKVSVPACISFTSPPRDIINGKYAEAAHQQLTKIMCLVVVRMLRFMVSKYKKRSESLQLQLQEQQNQPNSDNNASLSEGKVKAIPIQVKGEEEEEEECDDVLRASITSEYITERISRWMKSVESYEKSQQVQQYTQEQCQPQQNIDTASTTTASSMPAAKMENQDMKRATEDWLRSPTRACIPKAHTPERLHIHRIHHNSHPHEQMQQISQNNASCQSLNVSASSIDSPIRFDHLLGREDSLENSDVWNISADESSSTILENDARELSFSAVTENA